MPSFFRKLFAGQSARTTAARRRPRLGVEALGERIVPAALASISLPPGFGGLGPVIPSHGTVSGTDANWSLSGSTLRISDGHSGDTVQFGMNGKTSQIQVTDAQGHASGWANLPLLNFVPNAVEFSPGASNESFANLSPLSSSMDGVGQFANGRLTLNAGTNAALETRADGSQWLFANGNWYRPAAAVTSVVSAGVTTSIPAGAGTVYRFDHAGSEQTYALGLQDAGLRDTFTKEVAADRSLSRADVLNLFTSVEAEGATVSAAELHDLRAIVASPSVGLAPDVANLANKVVNADPANTNPYSSPAMAPGNLQAGSPTAVLQDLAGKWFLGNDLPEANYGATYYTIDANLFGASGTPQMTDVAQGSDGDCYLLAALADAAQVDPKAIEDMIHDNGDGTYTVRFYRWTDSTGTNMVADYVTVNDQLPLYSMNQYSNAPNWMQFQDANRNQTLTAVSADGTTYTANGPLWVGLIEKAYAQFEQDGILVGSQAYPNSYDTITGGDGSAAVEQITGLTANFAVGGDDGDGYNSSYAPANDSAFLYNQVTSGAFVQLGSWSGDSADGIASGHAYTVTGYNANTGMYTVYNPWGYASYADQTYGSTLQMTAAQISHDFAVIETVLLPGTEAGEISTLHSENAMVYDAANGEWSGWYSPAPDALNADAGTQGHAASAPAASAPAASAGLAGLLTPAAPQSPRPAESHDAAHADTFHDAAFMSPLGSLEDFLGQHAGSRYGLKDFVLA